MTNNLSPSELILNPDGSIYHLGLTPDDIAQNIITVGDPNRVKLITERFENVRVFCLVCGVLRGGGRVALRPFNCLYKV